jgi:hypothetical protein
MKKPEPSAAIITGVGLIGFGLMYDAMDIFPSRTGFDPRWTAITPAEEPVRFQLAILLAVVAGVACITWGLVKLMRR